MPRNHVVQNASLLGGSWAVISGVISKVTIVITHIRGLITPLTTTHEPPSTKQLFQTLVLSYWVLWTFRVHP